VPLVAEVGIRCPVLVQDDVEAATRYGISGTPAACLLDERGHTVGQAAAGAAGVLGLAGIMPGPGWSRAITPYGAAGECVDRLLADQAAAEGVEAIESVSIDLDRNPGTRASGPNVSVVLCTRDRPALLQLALECYRRQTYSPRDLIVVDSGRTYPADEAAVAAVGGRLIRVAPEMPLGAKLNRGVSEARGPLCQKWDDDDWYAPRFLETLVTAFLCNSAAICRPAIGYMTRALWFDVERWRILTWFEDYLSGGTLLFARDDWESCPFREIRSCEDFWFLADQLALGAFAVPVKAGSLYMYVRHGASREQRGHSWTDVPQARSVDEYLSTMTEESQDPAALLPAWALTRYRDTVVGARPEVQS
jgi:hypothetical protein